MCRLGSALRLSPQIDPDPRPHQRRRFGVAPRIKHFGGGDMVDEGGREQWVKTVALGVGPVAMPARAPLLRFGAVWFGPIGGAAAGHGRGAAFHVPNEN